MFALSNVTHRNTITEADYFITHITNNRTNAKIIQMRYHGQVLVDLNKHKQNHYRLISTVGWYMKNTRA